MIDSLFKRISNIQILLNTASSIAMIVDSIVIGNFLGLEAIAAYGAVTPLLMIIMAISQVLSTGGQIRCSGELGRNNARKANGAASLTVLTGLVFSVVFVAAAVIFRNPICIILGAGSDAELLVCTKEYMIGFMIGAPAFVGMLTLVPFVQLDGDKRCVLVSVIVMTAGDIVGDLLAALVFDAGMFGIGLASSLSYYAGAVVLLCHFRRADNVLKLSIKDIDFKECAPIVTGGLPAALQKVLRSLLSLTLNRVLLAIGGSSALGIFSVVNSIINLCNSLGQGMGAGTLLITGIYAAEKDKRGLRDIVKAFLKQSLTLNTFMFIAVFAFAGPLISLFTRSGEVDAAEAALALRLGAVDFVFFSVANCFKNLYQGLHDRKLTYLLTVCEAFLFSALFSWPLGKFLGTEGICMDYAFGDAMTLLFLTVFVMVRKHSVSFSIDNFILLRDGFGLKDEDYYKASLTSLADEKKAAEEMESFLAHHNINEETGAAILSSAEKLCGNIFAYGFKTGKKNHLDVSLLYDKGRVTLRLRDDCRKFDPVAYYSENKAAAGSEKHGLDEVFEKAAEIKYLGTLGLNNLTLTFDTDIL